MGCTPIKKTKPVNTRRRERAFSEVTLSIMDDFTLTCDQFVYKQPLGSGKYGRVFLAECLETHQRVAIKAIPQSNVSNAQLLQEIKILSEVDHPNIVKYLRQYHSEQYLYLVMEYCEGEELFHRIAKGNEVKEKEAAEVMEKLLRAINHCHHLGIIHRDLKPENIMYSTKGIIKVIDFGLSMKLDSFFNEGIAGTAYYIAPEAVKSGVYTKACDIWSLGAIMYVLLSGCPPVAGNEFEDIVNNLKEFKAPVFDLPIWNKISSEAKDLITRMLNPNFGERITASEALNHPWFKSIIGTSSLCNTSIIEALQKYSEFPESKKDFLGLIVKNSTDVDLKEYQEVFLELDKKKTGVISSTDLEEALNVTGNKLAKKELEELIRKINPRGDTFISYSEFLAALIATKKFLTEERLKSIFKLVEFECIRVSQKRLSKK